jgi:hypothetical protein
MAATFTATLAPPPGAVTTTVYQGKSGATYALNSDGHLVITDERDCQSLIAEGWTVISITRG